MRGALGLIVICAIIWIFWMSWIWLRKNKPRRTFNCYEVHRANMPKYGCVEQCKECGNLTNNKEQ